MTRLQFSVESLPVDQLPIGIRAENDVTQIALDFSAWAEEFGAGVVQLLLKRSGDTAPYPVLLTQSGSTALWTVSVTDLAHKGQLLAEWVYTVGTQVKKSVVLRFLVLQDIGAPGTAPDPYEDWLEQLLAAASDIEAMGGIYYGTEPPTDPNVRVWIDPSGDGVFCPVPAGGTSDQFLGKRSNSDYDLEWKTPSGGGGGGTSDYSALSNKPSIEGVTLTGNKTASDLGLAKASDVSGKQAKITASGILKGDGNGGVSAATAGTDYGTYSKPSGGIPASDMANAVQTSLGKADTAYQKPSSGIPAEDLASGVIPSVPSPSDATPQALGTAAAGSSANYSRADHVHQRPTYTAADVGAIAAPESPSVGDFMVYTSNGWGAVTMAEWQGGSY